MASDVPSFEPVIMCKKCIRKFRGITGQLRRELYSISVLYDELSMCSLELYKLNYSNDEEIIFEAGKMLSNSSLIEFAGSSSPFIFSFLLGVID